MRYAGDEGYSLRGVHGGTAFAFRMLPLVMVLVFMFVCMMIIELFGRETAKLHSWQTVALWLRRCCKRWLSLLKSMVADTACLTW